MGHSDKNDNYIKEGKHFYSYKTKDEVYNQFNTRQPMSIIQLENGYYLIAMTRNTYIHIHALNTLETFPDVIITIGK
jgi:hypothetical protein